VHPVEPGGSESKHVPHGPSYAVIDQGLPSVVPLVRTRVARGGAGCPGLSRSPKSGSWPGRLNGTAVWICPLRSTTPAATSAAGSIVCSAHVGGVEPELGWMGLQPMSGLSMGGLGTPGCWTVTSMQLSPASAFARPKTTRHVCAPIVPWAISPAGAPRPGGVSVTTGSGRVTGSGAGAAPARTAVRLHGRRQLSRTVPCFACTPKPPAAVRPGAQAWDCLLDGAYPIVYSYGMAATSSPAPWPYGGTPLS
jgi:hypothetical protein